MATNTSVNDPAGSTRRSDESAVFILFVQYAVATVLTLGIIILVGGAFDLGFEPLEVAAALVPLIAYWAMREAYRSGQRAGAEDSRA